METFADIKRRMVTGTKMTLIKHSWYPASELINKERTITMRQSNAVEFSGGSWWFFPPAKDVTIESENSFSVALNPENPAEVMVYEFNKG